ncbi:sterol O-acyltransferase 1 [Bactrocera neohumeralis]|uniref:sterol O-acyltransferase 1 n=1 Tax=Bactrocera neohumeralis TaxID=98809 RepID=UPI00216686DB|nr:sterol O-acyltransferase 1 [Bactrocera neohumeralis]
MSEQKVESAQKQQNQSRNQIGAHENAGKMQKVPTQNNNSILELDYLRERLQHLQDSLLKDFKKCMNEEIENVVQELRQHELQLNEFRGFAKSQHTNTWSNRIAVTEDAQTANGNVPTEKSKEINAESKDNKLAGKYKKQPRPLPDKVFKIRESYLTALLEVDHMRTIYHIFVAILLMLLIQSISYDYLAEGRVYFGLGTFKSSLEKIEYVFGIWLLEHTVVFLLYYAFKMWTNVRVKLARQPALQSFWSHSCLITYISSQLLFGYVASALCLKLDLTFITASILLLESTRLLMKMHSFVRTNAGRVLAGKLKTDALSGDVDDIYDVQQSAQAIHLPSFSSYLYFLFAPTLIYRDSYPRTTHIRWKFALARFMEVVGVAFFYSYIFERHIRVQFENIGNEELSLRTLVIKLHSMVMPNNIIFLCGFYLILHSWLNFTSELLRFGDRMFYKDWWTSSTYDEYFRNWNVVVHDWLYEYIYKDSYNHLFKGAKLPAMLMVFYTSALVHEHIIGFALKLFFPVMFCFFGGFSVGLLFLFRNASKRVGNFVVWFTLIFGNGLLFSLYSIEYYARQNCPRTYESWTDYFVPTVWTCYNR